LFFALTLYCYTDEEIVEWFQKLHLTGRTASEVKEAILWSVNTQGGRLFRLEGMLHLSVVGHRHLLHFLAEFSYPKTYLFLVNVLKLPELPDAAGLFPYDIASREVYQALLTDPDYAPKELLLHRKTNEEIQQILRRYNQELKQQQKNLIKEKANLLSSSNNSESTAKILDQSMIPLIDSCITSGHCPYAMKYLSPFLDPSKQSKEQAMETLIPGSLYLIRNFLSPNRCQELLTKSQSVYSSADVRPPNSLNYHGFTIQNMAMEIPAFSLAYDIAKNYQSLLGYENTRVLSNTIHSFIISYDNSNKEGGSSSLRKHVDDSIWTANLCLESVSAKNAIRFWVSTELSTEGNHQKRNDEEEHEDNIVSVIMQQGELLIHHGKIYHETCGMIEGTEGKRTNLVIWYKEIA
jgi:hypothetical protein